MFISRKCSIVEINFLLLHTSTVSFIFWFPKFEVNLYLVLLSKKQPSIPSQSVCNPYQVIDYLSNYYFKEIMCSPIVFVLAPIMHINGHNGNGLYKFSCGCYNKFSLILWLKIKKKNYLTVLEVSSTKCISLGLNQDVSNAMFLL